MAFFFCTKCHATITDKRKIPAHVKKCGNRRFAVFQSRG
jgi:hypothetical protein